MFCVTSVSDFRITVHGLLFLQTPQLGVRLGGVGPRTGERYFVPIFASSLYPDQENVTTCESDRDCGADGVCIKARRLVFALVLHLAQVVVDQFVVDCLLWQPRARLSHIDIVLCMIACLVFLAGLFMMPGQRGIETGQFFPNMGCLFWVSNCDSNGFVFSRSDCLAGRRRNDVGRRGIVPARRDLRVLLRHRQRHRQRHRECHGGHGNSQLGCCAAHNGGTSWGFKLGTVSGVERKVSSHQGLQPN